MNKLKIENYGFSINEINNKMKGLDPYNRMEWGLKIFGNKFCVSSSFGVQSAIMVQIVSKVDNNIPILFVDTGYHFPETIAYKDYLVKTFNLNIITLKPDLLRMEFEIKHGYAYEADFDFCCLHNKVMPLKKELKKYDCWATGIRRGQTQHRNNINFIQMIKENYKISYKLSPIADYNDNDVKLHYEFYNLPEHPLVRKGYKSIGCAPCTKPSFDEKDPRAGRWKDSSKKECGIHTFTGDGDGI